MKKGLVCPIKRKLIIFFLTTVFVISLSVSAQEYNFNFYNGNEVRTVDSSPSPEEVVIQQNTEVLEVEQQKREEETSHQKTPVKVIEGPQKVPTKTTFLESDRTKRTGVSVIGGYAQTSYRGGFSPDTEFHKSTFRAGLSLISSYDFNVDLEFLQNKLRFESFFNGMEETVKGDVPGISIGARNNYWIGESWGLTVGGNVTAMKGKISHEGGDYSFKSYGGSLSAGPIIELGKKVQLFVTYEYGLEKISAEGPYGETLTNGKFVENSALKGMLSLRL